MTQTSLVLVTKSLLHCGEPCGRIEHRGVNTSVDSIVSPHNLDSLPLILCDFLPINLCHGTLHSSTCTHVHHTVHQCCRPIGPSHHYNVQRALPFSILQRLCVCLLCLSVCSRSGFYLLTSGGRRWKVQKTVMLLYYKQLKDAVQTAVLYLYVS